MIINIKNSWIKVSFSLIYSEYNLFRYKSNKPTQFEIIWVGHQNILHLKDSI